MKGVMVYMKRFTALEMFDDVYGTHALNSSHEDDEEISHTFIDNDGIILNVAFCKKNKQHLYKC